MKSPCDYTSVPARERERGGGGRDRQTDRETYRHTERWRGGDRHTEREMERGETDRERQTEEERKSNKQ